MTPLAEILQLLQSTTARGFAQRHPDHDLVLIEPYEKDRVYDYGSPLHPGGHVRFLARAVGKPIPVGRDSRAQVMLDHLAVSRLHLVLAFTETGWKVMDRSSNGSWLDGERMVRERATDLPFGSSVRMGRAMVVRMFPLEEFHRYASNAVSGSASEVAAPPAPGAPAPANRRTADTWRIPAQYVQQAAAQNPPSQPFDAAALEIDFNFDGPPQPSAPTVRLSRPRPTLPAAPQVPSAPQAPRAPQAPQAPKGPAAPNRPQKVADGDIEYEFEFDFEPDGRGGFGG